MPNAAVPTGRRAGRPAHQRRSGHYATGEVMPKDYASRGQLVPTGCKQGDAGAQADLSCANGAGCWTMQKFCIARPPSRATLLPVRGHAR